MDIILDAIVEFIFTFVFYWPGKVVLRTMTLGRYPPPLDTPHNQTFVAIIGFTSILLTVITIMHLW
jgi:hypothetical protein